jgi:hypothetical protein
MRLGEEITFGFDSEFVSSGTVRKSYNVIAGSYLSIAAIAGSVSPVILSDLRTKLQATQTALESGDLNQIAGLTREDLLGDLYQAGTLGYYAQYIALSHISGLQQKAYHYLAGGVGSLGYEPNVDTFFGLPRAITPGGVALNIPIINVAGTDSTDATKKRDYLLQIGMLSSGLEHAVPEQMFDDQDPNTAAPDAFSAVKALSKASAQGQRIYHLTTANRSATLQNIYHDSATMSEISNALSTGKEVITHTSLVSVPGYNGAGYIIFDPVTGEGAYKISGGQSGGFYGGDDAFAKFQNFLSVNEDTILVTIFAISSALLGYMLALIGGAIAIIFAALLALLVLAAAFTLDVNSVIVSLSRLIVVVALMVIFGPFELTVLPVFIALIALAWALITMVWNQASNSRAWEFLLPNRSFIFASIWQCIVCRAKV